MDLSYNFRFGSQAFLAWESCRPGYETLLNAEYIGFAPVTIIMHVHLMCNHVFTYVTCVSLHIHRVISFPAFMVPSPSTALPSNLSLPLILNSSRPKPQLHSKCKPVIFISCNIFIMKNNYPNKHGTLISYLNLTVFYCSSSMIFLDTNSFSYLLFFRCCNISDCSPCPLFDFPCLYDKWDLRGLGSSVYGQ